MKKSWAIIVDFDGTFIRGNSFRMWVSFLLKKTAFSHNKIFIQILFQTFRRKVIKSITHVEYKSCINGINYPVELLSAFYDEIKVDISDSVFCKINEVKGKGGEIFPVILSTAAPSCYMYYLAQKREFGIFTEVVCSRDIDGKFYDNYRENKVESFYAKYKSYDYYLFTDHTDDIFLSRNAKKTFLCNPSREVKEKFVSENVNFQEVYDESC